MSEDLLNIFQGLGISLGEDENMISVNKVGYGCNTIDLLGVNLSLPNSTFN